MNKKEMRKHILSLRDKLSDKEIIEKSNIILDRLKATDIFKNSINIMCFASFGSEVNTYNFIEECIKNGKNIYLPYIDVQNDEMKISLIKSLNQLEEGYKGILEIKKEYIKPFDKKELDLIITPCVCYDLSRYRIGYGKGFYDRFFLGVEKAYKIGICFDECIVEQIEIDKYDLAVDMVISDKRVII